MVKILIIEDDRSIRQSLSDVLTELADYTVVGARDGQEGLGMAREHHPDLILCDMMMPGLNGLEVLAELRKDARLAAIPFMFLTAWVDPAERRAGLEAGADDFITKPFSTPALIKQIAERLANGKRAP
jgi:two-component system sensor kinase